MLFKIIRNPSCTVLILCLIFSIAFSSDAWSAAARKLQEQRAMQEMAVRQQYQQAMAQRQMQMQQQVMAQKQAQAQQVAAYQQAAAQYAAQKKAMQMAVAKRQAELQMANQVKGQIVQKRAQEMAQAQQVVAYKQAAQQAEYNQAYATRAVVAQQVQQNVNQQVQEYAEYLAARKQALTKQAVAAGQVKTKQAMVQRQIYEQSVAGGQQVAAQVYGQAVKERAGQAIAQQIMATGAAGAMAANASMPEDTSVVDIQDLWKSLDGNSYAWDKIIDLEIKTLTIAEYIDRFRKFNIKIKKKPGDYVQMIDAIARQNPGFLAQPFMDILSYVAIVEYDFENGKNKDDLALQVLGESNFKANRVRVFGN